MKLKLSYAVKLEEIPEKILNLLEESETDIENLSDKIDDCLHAAKISDNSVVKYEILKNSIYNLRLELASIDQSLLDIDSILASLISLESESSPPVPHTESPSGEQNADKG